ncbi:sugar ABC transporter permease [Actinoplanes sp. NBRC 14428]|uniref:Carbohydrate ABC transporter membrane protein 2 (CUT1 family) n=1 Tax=Pseudosporangium ferrugineum TaxID=439699 RepID=A0A2T0S275_9ACTN|nr:carbohydrate ABC transporter permease [Pseudosporangium ferrugineum]PRY27527.1 carbohydrate ABC transporter membrane protein 2 (CUT1 family) [Pseudosporangium ferrugineum]BCJ55709.1 sugar ABC transporter permease [Actinoplanes sp. NBRC 14428]
MRTTRRLLDAVAIVVAAVTVFPIYWMVLAAVKPPGEIQSLDQRPWTLAPSLDAFRRVISVDDFGRYFLNSVAVALVVVAASGLLAFLAAVALTRFRFRFRTTVLVLFLIAQMVPIEALTIPLFFLVRDLGTTVPGVGLNTLGSLMLVHTAFTLPFAIWMLRGFVAAIPDELDEAAQLDGAGRFTILWRILFPLVAPGLAATSVFSFITAWNDFLFARTFIISATDRQTLPMALLVFFKPDQNDWGAIMAASSLMTVPVLIFFLLVRRRLVAGLGGAVKD